MQLQIWTRLGLRPETQAQAQAQAQPHAQAEAQAQAAHAELEACVTPQLLDRDMDPRHCSCRRPRRGC
jgi:hypothetical protein